MSRALGMSKRSLDFKLKVLDEIDKGGKKISICQKYEIAPSTPSTFVKDKDKRRKAKQT